MAPLTRLGTVVSTKGRVILPKTLREQRKRTAGTRLVIEDTADGVLLKAAPVFAPTCSADVYASLPFPSLQRESEILGGHGGRHRTAGNSCGLPLARGMTAEPTTPALPILPARCSRSSATQHVRRCASLWVCARLCRCTRGPEGTPESCRRAASSAWG